MNILTTVHNNGIVNQCQIIHDLDDPDNKTQVQLIWNGEIHATHIGLNSEPGPHGGKIKNYRAIYLDGIMVVKNGKPYPRKWWEF